MEAILGRQAGQPEEGRRDHQRAEHRQREERPGRRRNDTLHEPSQPPRPRRPSRAHAPGPRRIAGASAHRSIARRSAAGTTSGSRSMAARSRSPRRPTRAVGRAASERTRLKIPSITNTRDRYACLLLPNRYWCAVLNSSLGIIAAMSTSSTVSERSYQTPSHVARTDPAREEGGAERDEAAGDHAGDEGRRARSGEEQPARALVVVLGVEVGEERRQRQRDRGDALS